MMFGTLGGRRSPKAVRLCDNAASAGMLGHGADERGRRASKGHTEGGVRASEAKSEQRGHVRE